MLRAFLRDLVAHRARMVLTVMSVVVGVAFVVTSWIVTTAGEQADAVRRDDGVVLILARQQGWLTEAELRTAAGHVGAAEARGVLRGYAAVAAGGGFAVGSHERAGIAWSDGPALRLTAGRAPADPDEVAVSAGTGLPIGARAELRLEAGRRYTARVVGVFEFRSLGPEAAPAVAFDPATAHLLLGGRYDRVEVRPVAGLPARTLAASLRSALPGAEVTTGADAAAELRSVEERQAFKARVTALSFGGIAVLAGGFLIANTFAMLTRQRVRQLALLRAVGATRRQIRRAVLTEAAVTGLVGGVIGVVLGHAAAAAVSGFVLSPGAGLLGLAVGVLVTVAGAFGSARRAAASAPVVALRPEPAPTARRSAMRAVAGAVLITGGAAAIAGTAGTGLSGTQTAVALAGVLLLTAGALVASPSLVAVALRPRARSERWRRPVLHLAMGNAARDPRRTAATAAALIVGLAVVCGFATLGATAVTAFTADVSATVPGDTVVVRSPELGGSLPADVLSTSRATPGHDASTGVRTGYGTVDGRPVRVVGLDPAALGAVLRPPMVTGRTDLAHGALVPADDAAALRVRVGDLLRIRVDERELPVRVAGVYRQSQALYGILVADATIGAALPDRYDAVYLRPAAGTAPGGLRASVTRALDGRPDVVVSDGRGLLGELVADVEATVDMLYALMAAALVIAAVGVVNTLLLAVLERTRELATLRALGATRAEVRRMVLAESMVICGYGGLLGIGVGCVLGAVLQHVLLDRPLWRCTLAWPAFGGALAGVLAVGALAAWWPARQAARAATVPAVPR